MGRGCEVRFNGGETSEKPIAGGRAEDGRARETRRLLDCAARRRFVAILECGLRQLKQQVQTTDGIDRVARKLPEHLEALRVAGLGDRTCKASCCHFDVATKDEGWSVAFGVGTLERTVLARKQMVLERGKRLAA